jgi:G3E family GTPase
MNSAKSGSTIISSSGIDETMVMLQSGCVCCTIRGELSAAIKDLHSRRERGLLPPFRRLIIESTGLADPFPILSTVRSDSVLRHHFCLGNVITTVDAVNGAQQLDAQPGQVLTCWMSFAQRSRIGGFRPHRLGQTHSIEPSSFSPRWSL